MAVKTIGRDKIRGKHLDSDCYKANISRYEYGPDDPRVYCYGIEDIMTDELIHKCKVCKAHVSNVTPPEETRYDL